MSNALLYSKKDSVRIENLFATQIFFMQLFGNISPKLEKICPPALSIVGRIATKILSSFRIFLTLHLAVLFIATSFDSFYYGELEDFTDALTLLIIYSFATFACVYFIVRTRYMKIFFESVNRDYEHHSMPGLTYVSAYRPYNIARKLTNYWLFACIIVVMFWAMSPLMLHQRILPVRCWYPFDTSGAYVYEALFVIQFLAQCQMGANFGNGSAIYVSIVLVMLGQYDVLFCSLKNIQSHSELLAGESLNKMRIKQKMVSIDEDELNQYIICQEQKVDMSIFTPRNNSVSVLELQRALKHSMKCCIRHHQFILSSCAKLENLFHPYCLVKSLQITLQLCLLVFIAVVGDRSIVRSINVIGYVTLTLIELFLFTYYGELLRTHSARAGEALLRSPWHKNSYLIKRDILIFLINSKKPVQLTAGKFFVMNVERLRSVLAQAFSFFTLLQKIAAKKP